MLSALLLSASKGLPAVLLYSALGLLSCGPGDNSQVVATSEPKPAKRPPAAKAPQRPAATPKAVCTLTNDTLAGQPFGAEPTVAELLRAGAKVSSRKPFANLHVAGQTDTILVLRHQGNQFEFYRTFEKDLLRLAIITNFRPSYGQRLRFTLTESARQNGGPCNQLRIRDTERANNVSATFTAGQPSVAHVQPYWD
ncbi:hypothetical protein [Hymenobacter psychrotolerans]|uniref:Uncharacterized protein n=1 Tax=Hymenobacter psychrotolerans DSM 18569 TaxID=1121959 RepID=A0A1M7CAV7_9BACT|nr:hypothetical protein [Hymenobacter psychrotolerans]SHL64313.1 hypothetical protein SAMN02746009_03112 [Hymenobacter psychrotolerans DSM 18569]